MLFTQPWVSIWLCEATDPTWWGVDKGQPLVPGAPGLHSRPWIYKKRVEGERLPHRQESLVWSMTAA